MKFKKGDRIKVPRDDGQTYSYGQIEDVSGMYYYIIWDHIPGGGPYSYREDEILDIWEYEFANHPSNMAVINNGNNWSDADYQWALDTSQDLDSASCDHKWVKYHGLSASYDFCEKCNEKKED